MKEGTTHSGHKAKHTEDLESANWRGLRTGSDTILAAFLAAKAESACDAQGLESI